MKFKDLINDDLILLDCVLEAKEEVIKSLVEKLYEDGALESKKEFYKTVMEREASSPTGLEDGLAIPHGKSTTVKYPRIAIARTKNSIAEWESVDDENEVNLIFLIAIPKGESGSTHIDVLTKLTSSFMVDGFIENLQKTKTKKELLAAIYSVEETEEKPTVSGTTEEKFIVAVTACPTGIAHTFMAAEKIKSYCKNKGYKCKVETQGSDGVKNKLSIAEINKADGIILAVDVPIQDDHRFDGANYVKIGTQAILKSTEETIKKAIKLEKSEVVEADKNSGGTNGFLQHVMTGISYMIPVLVLAGLLLAMGNISSEIFGKDSIIYKDFFSKFGAIGFMTMKIMYAFFAGYLAYSIAGKPALVPAFIGGMMTDEPYRRFFHKNVEFYNGFVPSGFFGAIAIGFLIGYLVKFLNNKIKIKQELTTIKTMLIVPLLTGIVLVISMIFVINPIFGAANKWLFDFFTAAGDAGKFAYNSVIAFGTAFDLGGPINKAAGAVALGLNLPETPEIFNLTARTLSIIIPPIGIGFAVNYDKFKNEGLFTTEERVLGSTSLLLGVCGVSEGAIPFLLKNPILIIANVVGSVVGSIVAVYLGAIQTLPLPAVWGWGLVDGVFPYLIGILSGATTVAVLTIVLMKKTKKTVKN